MALQPVPTQASANGVLAWIARAAATINSIIKAINNSQVVAQIVNVETGVMATGTTQFQTANNTIPTNTQGDQYMSLAITPKNINSTLVIDVVFNGSTNLAAGTLLGVGLFQDNTVNALAATFGRITGAGSLLQVSFRHKMVANTTSATTFKVRAGGNAAGTTTFNGELGLQLYGGVMPSSITITEYLPTT